MAITPPPTPPNTGNPAELEQRADTFFGWFPTMVDDFNNDLPLLRGKTWATRGGSANAITLTAGVVSLVTGTQVRFRATSPNTGATTINLDGLGAIACRTITGIALPAGYIRTDTQTVATYDGTFWVVDRQIERGENANGNYSRLADGTQICISTGVEFTFNNSGNLRYSWTYPASFGSTPFGQASFSPSGSDYISIAIGDLGAVRHTGGTALADYFITKATGAPNFEAGMGVRNARLMATGYWY